MIHQKIIYLIPRNPGNVQCDEKGTMAESANQCDPCIWTQPPLSGAKDLSFKNYNIKFKSKIINNIKKEKLLRKI